MNGINCFDFMNGLLNGVERIKRIGECWLMKSSNYYSSNWISWMKNNLLGWILEIGGSKASDRGSQQRSHNKWKKCWMNEEKKALNFMKLWVMAGAQPSTAEAPTNSIPFHELTCLGFLGLHLASLHQSISLNQTNKVNFIKSTLFYCLVSLNWLVLLCE